MHRVVGLLLAVVAMGGCVVLGDRGLDEPSPAVLQIEIELDERVETTFEMQLSEADTASLGLASAIVADDYGVFLLRTSHTATQDKPYEHCFADDIVIHRIAAPDEITVISAGTCLADPGQSLVVPAPSAAG